MQRQDKFSIVILNFGGGGAEKVCLNVAMDLSARDHLSEVIAFDGTGELSEYFEALPVPVVDLKRRKHGWFVILARLFRRLHASKPTVVLSFLRFANVTTFMAACLLRTRVVVSERNSLKAESHKSYRQRVFDHALKHTYRNADYIIAVSEQLKRQIIEKYNVNQKKIAVIYNGVKLPISPTTDPPELLQGSSTRLRVVTAGRLEPQKNHKLLLEAFALLQTESTKPVDLFIAGQGSLRSALSGHIRRLRLNDCVHLLGYVKPLDGLLMSADIFVLSSDFEGFPNVLLEAMSAGICCISTDCPTGPGEIISNERDGLLVPVGDKVALCEAIAKCVDSEQYRMALGLAARKRAADFGMDQMVMRFDEILLDIQSQHARKS